MAIDRGSKSWRFTLLSLAAFLSACATHKGGRKERSANAATEVNSIDSMQVTSLEPSSEPSSSSASSASSQKSTSDDELEVESLAQATRAGLVGVPSNQSIARVNNPWVAQQIRNYVRDHARFQRHLNRAEPYREVVQRILALNGVPPEVFYLGLVESGFRSHAESSADAVGVWQFIEPTGQRYGLKVNGFVDERRDPIRATEAAAKYLKDLHNVFNSWELALAAYNTGEGRILHAIMRAKSRDFWVLVQKNVLPTETADYVPKFIAALTIGEHPEKYGFDIADTPDHPHLKLVTVPRGPVSLRTLARASGLPDDALLEFNSHLLRGVTPPNENGYRVWVPAERFTDVQKGLLVLQRNPVSGEIVLTSTSRSGSFAPQKNVASSRSLALGATRPVNPFQPVRKPAAMAAPSVAVDAVASENTLATKMIFVRRGETLVDIARRYRVSVSTLKRLNNLKTTGVLPGKGLLVPVSRVASVEDIAPAKRSQKKASVAAGSLARLVHYKVKRGDNLSRIADRFGISVETLRQQNDLKRETVFAGEVLRIAGPRGI